MVKYKLYCISAGFPPKGRRVINKLKPKDGSWTILWALRSPIHIRSFIHSFNKYSLNLFLGPGSGIKAMNETAKKPLLSLWWVCTCSVTKSCSTLCKPMDCSPPGSSVHGISQARILEWIAISSSRGSSWLRDQTSISCVTTDSLPLSHLGSCSD